MDASQQKPEPQAANEGESSATLLASTLVSYPYMKALIRQTAENT